MSHAQFRAALNALAAAENDGEDIEDGISHLAARAHIDAADVRAHVTEIQQDA